MHIETVYLNTSVLVNMLTQYLSLLPVPDKIIYAGTHFRVGNNHLSFWNRANMSGSPIYCQHFANIPIAKPKKQEHGGKG